MTTHNIEGGLTNDFENMPDSKTSESFTRKDIINSMYDTITWRIASMMKTL